MAKIYQAIRLRPDKLIGRIDASDGRIYDTTASNDVFIGQVDYETSEVYDEDDYFIGWVEDNGEIFASYEGEDESDADESEYIGHVDDKGTLYLYEDDGETVVGSVTEMTHKVEAAAALLMFFGEEEEE